ncbi:haloacid dehalogenase type II [Xylophilus rhododendri]|uniref:Haloacid dehalogenase type II n=1 Tax=Xylophilus rhododendri TaxID=2697032 RepID=A0A857J1D7_9BURK|nr:haloacid dehalogenase type II [Xylophilus rhododendri]QHI97724.1 haloacid dehalogenase type II [Xylophilus rhododendri]
MEQIMQTSFDPVLFNKRAFVKAVGAALATTIVLPAVAAENTGSIKMDFNPGQIKAIVFDTVGTLLDTYGSITRKGAAFTESLGIQVDWVQLLDQWRAEWRKLTDEIAQGKSPWRSADFVYREALDKTLVSYEWGTRLNAADRDQLNYLWYQIDPWADTKPGLERLKNRFTLSTLSNGSMASLVQMIKSADLPFDCILTAELVKSAKPDPKVYALAANSLNLRPEQILMVAAHKYDLEAAKKFGFSVGFLPRPLEYGPRGKVDIGPEAYFDLMQPDLVRMAQALGA